jgi:transposase
VLRAYNWATGEVAWQQHRKKHSETFAFLEHLAFTLYPHQRLVLVMDKASYHTSRGTQAVLAALEGHILVFWLPKYSPFLNPIERFWLHLKNLANPNCLHPDFDSLAHEIDVRMTNQNTLHHPDRLKFVENLRSVA